MVIGAEFRVEMTKLEVERFIIAPTKVKIPFSSVFWRGNELFGIIQPPFVGLPPILQKIQLYMNDMVVIVVDKVNTEYNHFGDPNDMWSEVGEEE